jgi:aldehyde:ferredoxin oxidoreductase
MAYRVDSPYAIVDLSSGRIDYDRTPEELVRKFFSGRGLNMYYLYKYLRPGTDAFDPDNPLIFGTGLLTGTPSPSPSRMNVTFKSPESGILGDGNIGGHFGARLRSAGFDRLIFRGRADAPSYVLAEDGKLSIHDGAFLVGLDSQQKQEALRERLGTDIQVATIGQSGEKLVRYACVRNGLKASARCGGGAVMGAKNLLAIAARGKQRPGFDNKEFIRAGMEQKQYLYTSKVIRVLGTVGTAFLYDTSNHLGTIRTNNSMLNFFDDSLNAEEIEEQVEKMVSCFGCGVHCRHKNNQGGEGPEYSTTVLIGSNIGISGADRIVTLNNICNDLGFDTSSVGSILSWAFELYERGIITKEHTGGLELRFGDIDLVKQLLYMIDRREGFGDVLAEGTYAWKTFGKESLDYLIAIKGLPQSDPHDVRYIKAFALGIAVASRGADHLRNRPTLEILELPEDVTEQIYGTPTNPDMTAYDTKEHVVKFSEDIFAVGDALGICRFVTQGFNSPHMIDYERFSTLIEQNSGWQYDAEQLKDVATNILDLERMINMREGISRADDTLPKRYFDDPMPGRLTKGHKIDRDEFAGMLTRYYRLRGWTDEGVPSKAVVDELNALVQPEVPLVVEEEAAVTAR